MNLLIKIIFIFLIKIHSVFAQQPSFVEYPQGYKPVYKTKDKSINKKANKIAKNSKFNKTSGYVKVSLESGDSFYNINNTKYKGRSFNLSISKYGQNSFSQIRLGKTSLSDDLGSFSKMGFYAGYSPILTNNIRPYLALGINKNSFSQKNNTLVQDFKSYSPALMFGSSLYYFGKFSIGIKYIIEDHVLEEYDSIKNQEILMDFSLTW